MAVTNPGEMVDFNAASADYLGTGAVQVPEYEEVILDQVARSSVALQRFEDVPATGAPHRYFEQIGIATGSFSTTGGQGSAAMTQTVTGPTRVEKYAAIKAITAQSNITLFDKLVTQQQKRFAKVIDKDIKDIISGVNVTRASAIWNGNDTSLSSPTTVQYMGILSQITQQATIAPGSSIIDGLAAEVAVMLTATTTSGGSVLADVRPTAIYVNPRLADYIAREAKAAKVTLDEVEVVAGVKVKGISTQCGVLPLISERFLPAATGAAYGFSAPPAGNKNYFAVIVTEDLIELPYISGEDLNPNPMLFQLGLQGNLTGQFVAVKFDAVIAKGEAYAHSVVCVQRP